MKKYLYIYILNYLRFWARIRLSMLKPRIVGVTGSVGKSSFVELLELAAQNHFKTKTTLHGNSESGIPLEILGLRDKLGDYSWISWLKVILSAPYNAFFGPERYELLIAEMGIDSSQEPKNMSYLLTILRPDIGVILNVSPVHSLQFGKEMGESDPDKISRRIAEEKMKLAFGIKTGGITICNADDKYLNLDNNPVNSKVVTFGQRDTSDFKIIKYSADLNTGTKFTFLSEKKTYNLHIKNYVLFEEYGYTIAAVLAAAGALGITTDKAISLIESKFKLPPGRFSVLKAVKDATIIDSSYNSSPTALKASLDFLGDQKNKTRIAVLGDMRELGSLEKQEHEKIADLIHKAVDKVILIGPLMAKYTLSKLLKLNFPKNDLWAFENAKGVGEFVLKKVIEGGELILVKGSQNTIYLETIIEEFLSDPQDKTRLCRQSEYWKKTRTDFFAAHPNTRVFPK